MVLRERASIPRTIGSLWFAAVLLMLLAVAMAAATVYEAREGTEHALAVFYRSWWFQALLGLLALNVLAAVVVRWPYTKRQIGFVVTHLAVPLILMGALVSKYAGLDGRVTIGEGQTVDACRLADHPVLAVEDRTARRRAELPLDPAVFMGFEEVSAPRHSPLICGDLHIDIRRYLPDAEESRHIVDGLPDGKPAIEVALISENHDFNTWALAGQPALAGAIPVAFAVASSAQEQDRWLGSPQPVETDSKGTVKIECDGGVYSYPLERCLDQPVAVGDTGYSIRVLRYVPHGAVGADRTIVSASSQPVNPYIEVELSGPNGTELRRAFARFPDFDAVPGATTTRAVKLTFEAPQGQTAAAPIEVLAGVDGRLFARFSESGNVLRTAELTMAVPIETPWAGWRFVVRQRRDGAGWEQKVEPVSPVRMDARQPAMQLAIRGPTGEKEVWVTYGRPTRLDLGGQSYELLFDDTRMPLDFQITLDEFRVVTYPGTQRPRSFESRVTIEDPRAGGDMSRVISMNRPLTYGGYNFYQSSYQTDENGAVSVLSVSRDPGRPIVFGGYVVLLVGMVWVLARRMAESRRVRTE